MSIERCQPSRLRTVDLLSVDSTEYAYRILYNNNAEIPLTKRDEFTLYRGMDPWTDRTVGAETS
jgi:hypothetical protein